MKTSLTMFALLFILFVIGCTSAEVVDGEGAPQGDSDVADSSETENNDDKDDKEEEPEEDPIEAEARLRPIAERAEAAAAAARRAAATASTAKATAEAAEETAATAARTAAEAAAADPENEALATAAEAARETATTAAQRYLSAVQEYNRSTEAAEEAVEAAEEAVEAWIEVAVVAAMRKYTLLIRVVDADYQGQVRLTLGIDRLPGEMNVRFVEADPVEEGIEAWADRASGDEELNVWEIYINEEGLCTWIPRPIIEAFVRNGAQMIWASAEDDGHAVFRAYVLENSNPKDEE